MDQAKRAAVVTNLQATRDALQHAVAGLSEAQARFKPSPDCWCVEEIVEHLAVTEHGMYRYITELHRITEDPHETQSAASLARTTDRKGLPLQAPERARPKGRFGSLNGALTQFRENRQRTIAFVEECRDDLRFRWIEHPVGPMNAQDCLTVLINHPARHVEQIAELKADPAFPR
jgi:uncharacterized damage-inducible protein DinB